MSATIHCAACGMPTAGSVTISETNDGRLVRFRICAGCAEEPVRDVLDVCWERFRVTPWESLASALASAGKQ